MKDEEQIEVTTDPAIQVEDCLGKEGVTSHGHVVDHGLHRALKARHLQMISLGGVIGYVCCFSFCLDMFDRGQKKKPWTNG